MDSLRLDQDCCRADKTKVELGFGLRFTMYGLLTMDEISSKLAFGPNLHTICTYISWFCKIQERHFLRNPPLPEEWYVPEWFPGDICGHCKERNAHIVPARPRIALNSQFCSTLLKLKHAYV